MNDVELFLAHSIELEREAARRYEELAAGMQTEGNRELQSFFARMGANSRKHLAQAVARSGFRDVPVLKSHEFRWPEGVAPETAGWAGVDALIDAATAVQLALDSERRGHAYYQALAVSSTDPEVKVLARSFADEEAEHVAELEKWLVRCTAA